MNRIKMGDRWVGDGEPVLIVAETAWAHDGKPAHMNTMIDLAADGRADMVNFHLTHLPSYMTAHFGLTTEQRRKGEAPETYKFMESIWLPLDAYEGFAAAARRRGLLVSTMCNDDPSLAFTLDRIDPDLLMIHPSCVGTPGFLERMAASGKPLLIYVGGLKLSEIEAAVSAARSAGNDQIVLQHGFQSYPTPIEFNRLRYLATLRRLFECPVSFGDHTDGADPFALVVPAVAVALGASMIEKHVTYDRAAKGVDFQSALDRGSFAQFVVNIRQTEIAMGHGDWRPLSPLEISYRSLVRKRAVAARALAAGHRVAMSDIGFKRSSEGVYAEQVAALLGRPLASPVDTDDPLTEALFESQAR